MDFNLTEEQQVLTDTVLRCAAGRCSLEQRRCHELRAALGSTARALAAEAV